MVFRARNVHVYMAELLLKKSQITTGTRTTAFEILCLFILSTTSSPTVKSPFFLLSLQAMADKRKAKGTKPTGQRKSATGQRDNDSAADKENSQTSNAVTSSSERPRPRPIKKGTVHSVKTERSEGDEGASMAVEALLSIRNGKSSAATTLKARSLSPTFRQVTPASEDDLCGSDGIENEPVVDKLNHGIINADQPASEDDAVDTKSSDEDGVISTCAN